MKVREDTHNNRKKIVEQLRSGHPPPLELSGTTFFPTILSLGNGLKWIENY